MSGSLRGEVPFGYIASDLNGDRLSCALNGRYFGRGGCLGELEDGVWCKLKLASASRGKVVQLGYYQNDKFIVYTDRQY